MMQTEQLDPDHGGIDRAATLLAQGALVAMPTETVYGLAGDARNSKAVAGIFAAKDRPTFNPLIVHVADPAQARELALWTPEADQLARAFWPGPLTLVLPLARGAGLSDLVTAGLPSVALRMPAHPVARALLRRFGAPLAAPSANPSGRISPTTADHVIAGLEGRIAAVLDGGPCTVGLESTIVGLTDAPALLRPGGIPAEQIEDILATPLATAGPGISAPGQMVSHYAPQAPVRLNVTHPKAGELHLGFGPIAGDLTLSATGDLTEAATALFGVLHQLDARKQPIAVAPVPDIGLGRAINDRLRRAAAPRP